LKGSAVLRLEWTKYAKADLLAILEYIANHDANAARRFKEEVDLRIGHLPRHPRLYKTGREAGTREIVVAPNYLVVYAETPTTVLILRVLHAAQQWPQPPRIEHRPR
jgi:toxin ParE1/3/4